MEEVPDLVSSDTINIPTKAIRLVAKKLGRPEDVIEIEEFEIPKVSQLKDDSLLVELIAAPMDYADLLKVRGYYGNAPPALPHRLGNEGVGKVVAKGKNVRDFKESDIVLINTYGAGTWSSHIIIDQKSVYKFDKQLDVISCSMLRVNICTAYRVLQDFVKLDSDSIIVQNGATSHVGQSVIQICKMLGIKTVNIVREPLDNKISDILTKMGGDAILPIPEKDALDTGLLTESIKKVSWFDRNRAVLGLNCIGGPYFHAVNELLKDGSPLVTYGGINKRFIDPTISSLIFRDMKYFGFSMGLWLETHQDSKEYSKMIGKLTSMIGSGKYYRPPFQCFPLVEYKKAIELFAKRTDKTLLPKRMILTRNTSFNQNLATLCSKIAK